VGEVGSVEPLLTKFEEVAILGVRVIELLTVEGNLDVFVQLRSKSRGHDATGVPLPLDCFGCHTVVFRLGPFGRGHHSLDGLVWIELWEVRTAREEGDGDDPLEDDAAAPLPVAVGKGLLGLVLLVVGSKVLVNGATGAALALGVSQTVIGLTIVSAGTGMPELVTSLVSVYRGRTDLAIGNVVGSNLMNLLLILGACAVATGSGGLAVDPVLISRDFPLMVAATLACLPIFWSGGVINRWE
ncbi:MAG: sodium:calcium antiporter, partial [Synechococcus sp.]